VTPMTVLGEEKRKREEKKGGTLLKNPLAHPGEEIREKGKGGAPPAAPKKKKGRKSPKYLLSRSSNKKGRRRGAWCLQIQLHKDTKRERRKSSQRN